MQIGSKVYATILTQGPKDKPGERTLRQLVPQVIIGPVESRQVTLGDGRTFTNQFQPVYAKHPITGLLYHRAAENCAFMLPRTTSVEGLDVLNGAALSIEALTELVANAQFARIEAAGPATATLAPAAPTA